jgi:hypothetical protein
MIGRDFVENIREEFQNQRDYFFGQSVLSKVLISRCLSVPIENYCANGPVLSGCLSQPSSKGIEKFLSTLIKYFDCYPDWCRTRLAEYNS